MTTIELGPETARKNANERVHSLKQDILKMLSESRGEASLMKIVEAFAHEGAAQDLSRALTELLTDGTITMDATRTVRIAQQA